MNKIPLSRIVGLLVESHMNRYFGPWVQLMLVVITI